MKIKCKHCIPNEGIEIPKLNIDEKILLSKLHKDSKLLLNLKLKEQYGFNLRDSKYLITHINFNYGKCNRCKFDKLDSEYINCPKCKALNTNWNLPPPLRED